MCMAWLCHAVTAMHTRQLQGIAKWRPDDGKAGSQSRDCNSSHTYKWGRMEALISFYSSV